MDHYHYLHVQIHVSWESASDTLIAKWNGNGFRSPGKTILFLVAIESITPGAEAPGILCVSDFSWVVAVERERDKEREREREREKKRDACDVDGYQSDIPSDRLWCRWISLKCYHEWSWLPRPWVEASCSGNNLSLTESDSFASRSTHLLECARRCKKADCRRLIHASMY